MPRYVEGTAAEIAAASGRRVVPVIGDVTKPNEVRRAVHEGLSTFGHIDVLLNALGDSIRKPLVAQPGNEESGAAISDDDLRFIMDGNLTEALLCTRAVGSHMLARRSGKVINIASWTAHQGGRDMVLYTTAKTALAGFTRAQALEWAPYGVHVNAGRGYRPPMVFAVALQTVTRGLSNSARPRPIVLGAKPVAIATAAMPP